MKSYYFTNLKVTSSSIVLLNDDEWNYFNLNVYSEPTAILGGAYDEMLSGDSNFYQIKFTLIPVECFYDKITCIVSMLRLKGKADNLYVQQRY